MLDKSAVFIDTNFWLYVFLDTGEEKNFSCAESHFRQLNQLYQTKGLAFIPHPCSSV
jgi:predicted nucleic acid-binding protein